MSNHSCRLFPPICLWRIFSFQLRTPVRCSTRPLCTTNSSVPAADRRSLRTVGRLRTVDSADTDGSWVASDHDSAESSDRGWGSSDEEDIAEELRLLDVFNKYGFNKYGFNKYGFNKYGLNTNGFDKDGFDKNGIDEYGFDKNGFDCFNKNGA